MAAEQSPSSADNDRLRAIVSHDADGVIVVDGGGAVRYLNVAAERLLDRHGAELRGQVFGLPLVVGERAEVEVLRPGGEPAVAEMRVLAIEWDAQPALLITLRDVSAERRAEAALRTAEAFSLAIINSLTSEIVVLDAQGVIIAVNEAWLRDIGGHGLAAPPLAGVGRDYLAACAAAPADSDGPRAAAGMRAVLAGAQAEFLLEYPRPDPAGTRWFALRAVPLRGPRHGLVVAHSDITAQREAAQVAAEADMLREQLRELERELAGVEALSRPEEISRRLVAPLRQRDGALFALGLARYTALIEQALASRVHGSAPPSRELRELGEWLGAIWATPRDLVEIHLRTIRDRSQDAPVKKRQAYIEEGRLLALELMGHLASHYRALAASEPPPARDPA